MNVSKEAKQAVAEMVDNLHREGGETRVEVNGHYRVLHFAAGSSRQLILERLTSTIETLGTWIVERRA